MNLPNYLYICSKIVFMEIHSSLYSVFRKHLCAANDSQWIFWESDGTFPLIPYPIRTASAAIFFCSKGYIDLEINLKSYRFSEQQVVVLLPEHILCIKHISSDFAGEGLLLSDTLWKEARRDVERMSPYYTLVKEMPCILITPVQATLLLNYLAVFRQKYQEAQTPYSPIITRKLSTVLLYEIYQLYIGAKERMPELGKNERIFQEFLKLVAIHFKEQRGILFYAESFQMTPRYFSAIIKTSSGQSAAEWIDNYVVAEAGILLRTSTLSIKEISDSLNFPDQSFFGKYFKRHTGVSPKQYRIL